MTDQISSWPPRRTRLRAGLAAIALLGAGGAIGATAARMAGPTIEVAPLNPVAIASLKTNDGLVTVKGKVGEVYGPAFVLADASGKALVDGGPRSIGLVTSGAPVTIQGWSRDGAVHATFLVGADGKVTPLGRMGGHGHGHDGPDGERHHGPRGDRDEDGPPPPAVQPAPPPPAPAGKSAG